MAYCPKCGVELDNKIKTCPLCHFPIPNIDENEILSQDKFPEAVNMHTDIIFSMRNRIYYAILIIGIITILATMSIASIANMDTKIDNFIIIFTASFLGYLFFLFGYTKKVRNAILGMGVVTILTGFALDYLITGSFDFSIYIVLPIALSMMVVIYFTIVKYKKGIRKNHYVFVPIYACIDCAILSIVIDLLVSHYFLDSFGVVWSVVASLSFLAFALILTALYYKLPNQVKEKLIKVLHI